MTSANPAPDDLIRETEAVAIAAGGRVEHGSATYSRLRQRLRAAARRGEATRSGTPGVKARYSRAEVEAAREQLGARAQTQRQHHRALRDQMAADGLVDTATAAKHVGVPQRTAVGWASRGLYGATKAHGQWWLERELLPSAPRPYEPPVSVKCYHCRELHSRAAWEVRNAQQTGQHLYCDTCWPKVGDRVTAENLAKGRGRFHDSDQARANRSAGQQARWGAASNEDRAAKRAELAQGYDAMLKSPTRRSARAATLVKARHGRDLTADERSGVERGARRRMQLDTDRSQSAREQERLMLELWPTGMTVPQIAETIRTTESNVKRMRRDLALPERPRGRPRRNS